MPMLNKFVGMGYLTSDPTFWYKKKANERLACARFRLAMPRWWTDRGVKREKICYIECLGFGALAERINKFSRKGKLVLVEAHLEYYEWEDEDGTARTGHKLIVEQCQFLARPPVKAKRPRTVPLSATSPPAAAPELPAEQPAQQPAERPQYRDDIGDAF